MSQLQNQKLIILYSLIILFQLLYVQSAPPTGKWFSRIIIITFENQNYPVVSEDDFFSQYASQGRLLTDFYGVAHPSQPNYWAQVAGDYFGHLSDNHLDIDEEEYNFHIADLLERKGLSWKLYQEDYPGDCFLQDYTNPVSRGTYVRKHNPLISFSNVRNNATRCSWIYSQVKLESDLADGTLPHFMYFTPNMDNDGHDTSVTSAGLYLNYWMLRYKNKFPSGTLIVVTWDEDNVLDNEGNNNHIHTFLLGSMITPKTTDNHTFNHYSLLKTIEENWDLGNLGRNDVNANHLFQYQPPTVPNTTTTTTAMTTATTTAITTGSDGVPAPDSKVTQPPSSGSNTGLWVIFILILIGGVLATVCIASPKLRERSAFYYRKFHYKFISKNKIGGQTGGFMGIPESKSFMGNEFNNDDDILEEDPEDGVPLDDPEAIASEDTIKV